MVKISLLGIAHAVDWAGVSQNKGYLGFRVVTGHDPLF